MSVLSNTFKRLAVLRQKLAILLRRDRFRSELAEEMAFHRSEAQQHFEAEGMTPREAYRAAARQFGNEARLRADSQREVGFRMETVLQDVRYAVRQMMRAPGLTLSVALTLALGIGATTAIFSAVRATLLSPLPYPDSSRIVSVRDERVQGVSTGGLSGVPRFYDLRARSRSFEALTCIYFQQSPLIVGEELPEHVTVAGVTGDFFQVFGVPPMLGREFQETDTTPDAGAVVILSNAAWKRYFHSNTAAVGMKVTINRWPYTVIGVMPESFRFSSTADLWMPSHFRASQWTTYRGEGSRFVNVYGRLKPGVSLESLHTDMSLIDTQLRAEHADTDASWRYSTLVLRDALYGDLKPALIVLMVAACILLLIACLNVANLLLARASERQREIALREALGASRRRIVMQVMTESLLLALLGGCLGLASAYTLTRVAATHLPRSLAFDGAISMSWQVVGFGIALSAASGLLFSLAPLQVSLRANLNSSLKRGESQVAGAAGSRLREVFIAIQMGLSLVLLISACLLAQSLWNLTRSPLGFQPDHVLTFSLDMPMLNGETQPVERFFSDVQQRVEALPGVTAVGEISALPTVNWHVRDQFDVDWLPRTTHHDAASAEVRIIAGDYLGAMHIPLLAGRALQLHDKDLLVNEEFVRQYMNGVNPLGKHLFFEGDRRIVGIIANVRGTAGSIGDPIQPETYMQSDGWGNRYFAVSTQLPPEQVISAVRSAVHQADPGQAVGDIRTLDEMLSVSTAQPRLNMALLVGFAAIALLLACIGIYGVVAYSVAQRRREIGVRMALGATRASISGLFLRRTMTSALIGSSGGTVVALLVTRLLRSQLYGIQPDNPMTFLIAAFLLLIPALLACLRPALKAASADPVEALRAE